MHKHQPSIELAVDPSILPGDITRHEAHAARAFFSAISPKRRFDGCFAVVTHMLEDRMPLLEAINAIAPIACIVPKPSSIYDPTMAEATKRWPVVSWSRSDLAGTKWVPEMQTLIAGRRFIALDIGGYWSSALKTFDTYLPGQLLGIVEGTKNGFKRYFDGDLTAPCVDISNSAIKRTEECPVADSIVSSVDGFLRETMHTNFYSKEVTVIGFGGIGEAVAHSLLHDVRPNIYDHEPVARVSARSKKFRVLPREQAIATSDLIICATGNHALTEQDFYLLKDGAIIFCVTSADDELDVAALSRMTVDERDENLLVCRNGHGHFYVALHGRAINFLHGAEVRPFIRLVQAGFIGAIDLLLQRPLSKEIHELDKAVQRHLAELFERHFFPTTY